MNHLTCPRSSLKTKEHGGESGGIALQQALDPRPRQSGGYRKSREGLGDHGASNLSDINVGKTW